MSLIFKLLTTLAIAVVLGLGSAWIAVSGSRPVGAVVAGPWVTWPNAGRPDADPYTRAHLAQSGMLPLGVGEGLTFTARRDSSGEPLDGNCEYRVVGRTPRAVLWTLTVLDDRGGLATTPLPRFGFHSDEILRRPDGSFEIVLSTTAVPGNWLAPPQGPFQLLLRLYDALLTSGASLRASDLPAITRGACS